MIAVFETMFSNIACLIFLCCINCRFISRARGCGKVYLCRKYSALLSTLLNMVLHLSYFFRYSNSPMNILCMHACVWFDFVCGLAGGLYLTLVHCFLHQCVISYTCALYPTPMDNILDLCNVSYTCGLYPTLVHFTLHQWIIS